MQKKFTRNLLEKVDFPLNGEIQQGAVSVAKKISPGKTSGIQQFHDLSGDAAGSEGRIENLFVSLLHLGCEPGNLRGLNLALCSECPVGVRQFPHFLLQQSTKFPLFFKVFFQTPFLFEKQIIALLQHFRIISPRHER
ncbi:hypothetical protein HF882_21970 [Victivallis vadensis]|uniref:Uncharacterized protein n=1 Tax=Victivallis vadensis TaxID=172901 RepID=A0A848B4Y4_9BACT|nr:hypothetical protein [Victivallis vadensis]NMD89257.1 hypothetical protein [Victivallis vadensis]